MPAAFRKIRLWLAHFIYNGPPMARALTDSNKRAKDYFKGNMTYG